MYNLALSSLCQNEQCGMKMVLLLVEKNSFQNYSATSITADKRKSQIILCEW